MCPGCTVVGTATTVTMHQLKEIIEGSEVHTSWEDTDRDAFFFFFPQQGKNHVFIVTHNCTRSGCDVSYCMDDVGVTSPPRKDCSAASSACWTSTSVFVTLAVSAGGDEGHRLVFVRQGVGLADVHPVLLRLQILVVALVLVVVLVLALARWRVAGERRRRRHGGRPRVTEARDLREGNRDVTVVSGGAEGLKRGKVVCGGLTEDGSWSSYM